MEIRRLAADGKLELVADPPDVSPYLARAHIAAVPLTTGGGTRLKILEAMAAGVPVVATPLAAEGLALLDGVHIRLAETDEDFVDRIEALCAGRDQWEAQRVKARQHALEAFGPPVIARAVIAGLGLGNGQMIE
jgi:glycosyltransferase involved in cell wall biosynthesis